MEKIFGSFEVFAELIIVFGILFVLLGRGKVSSLKEQRDKELIQKVLAIIFLAMVTIIMLLYFAQEPKTFVP